jgi:hypothetical protein
MILLMNLLDEFSLPCVTTHPVRAEPVEASAVTCAPFDKLSANGEKKQK